jgi:membrane dipeptidase
MNRFFVSCIVCSLILPAPFGAAGGGASEETMKLHESAIIFDAHCDTAMRLVGDHPIDLGSRHESGRTGGHMDLPRMKEGGLDAQIFAAWVDPSTPESTWVETASEMIDAVRNQARIHPDTLQVALRGADVRRIVKSGKIAAVLGIEGGHVIGEDLGLLDEFYRRGVRCMTITWMNTNRFADSSDDTMLWGGLNDLGRAVIREMDRLGMMIDCSHVSDSTFYDILAVTKNPVLISHSCMRALCDVPRNVSDDELRALKKNGGVVCINYFPGFLDKEYYDKVTKVWNERRRQLPALLEKYQGDREKAWAELAPDMREIMQSAPPVPVSRLIDHIDHAVSIVGVDHVGLGSDFDGINVTPVGLEDVTKLPVITEELMRRGYSKDAIRKILGGNLLGLMEKVCR